MKKLSKEARAQWRNIWRAVKKKLTTVVRKARKIKVCCDCGAVGTTKYCATCAKLRKKVYHQAYGKRRRAKIYATRPPKKCADCSVDLLGYSRNANRCRQCVRKLNRAAVSLWEKTPAGRAYKLKYFKKYYRTPEYHAKSTARNRSPEMVAYRKEYNQRPEVVARRKAFSRTPEGKEQQLRATLKHQAKKKKEAGLEAQGD